MLKVTLGISNRIIVYYFVYIAAIVVANLLVSIYGPQVSILNAFVLIGLDFTLRDSIQLNLKTHKFISMLFVIVSAGLISYLLNDAVGFIAVASLVAFVVSGIVDFSIFSLLSKHTTLMRMNVSNTGGAVVDSIIFPTMAFGVFLPGVILAQIAAKILGGFIWTLVFNRKQSVHTTI